MDRFIVDFACHTSKLIVELDGGQHGDTIIYDEARTKILETHGYRVLRFWNNDIFQSLEGVIDRIRNEVNLPTAFTYTHLVDRSAPTPTLPTRGRE